MEDLLKIAKNAFPPIEGTEEISALKEKVEILWDKYGIPHIFAQSAEDAYFAQGYVHSQHRLWQMETFRRLISGELAEIVGTGSLKSDKHYRIIGLHRIAKRCVKEMEENKEGVFYRLINAYISGVNHGIKKARKNPPIEFAALKIDIRDWKMEDSLKILSMIEWGLSYWNYPLEILREQIGQKLGPQKANLIIPMEEGIFMKGIKGSNGWVASPQKTKSGAALFANDPHLPLMLPAIWFIVHINCPEFNVVGSSFAGLPMVVIGHNEKIAWGCTNVHADTIDLFRLEINPENSYQYRFNGSWVDFDVIEEKITVNGQDDPVIQEVLISEFGPVVKYFEKDDKIYEIDLPDTLALRWSSHNAKLESNIEGFIQVNKAKNWKDFREGLSKITINPQNFIYADVMGNIGLQHGGRVPIRGYGKGNRITPGTSQEYNWKGLSDFKNLLSIYNPDLGFVYTANLNEDIAPNGVLLAMDRSEPYRQFRIKNLLEAKNNLTIQDFMDMQWDYFTLEANEILPLMLKYLKKNSLSEEILKIVSLLEGWDYFLTKDTVPGTIFKLWWENTMKVILIPLIGEKVLKPHLGACPFELERLFLLYQDNPKDLEVILLKSLQQTIQYLSEKISSKSQEWKWGNLHQLTLVHPFSNVNEQAKILNIGPFKIGGDTNTINNGYYDPLKDYQVTVGPSFRNIHDLSDWNKSVCVIPGGQSGLPFHPHYQDLIKLWVKGMYVPLLFERKEIENNLEGKITLQPAK